MRDAMKSLDRRSFLRAGVGVLFAAPGLAALSALTGCGDSGPPSATPAGSGAPPAAPAAPAAPPAPAPAAAVPADALVTAVAANAGLVSSLQYVNASPIPEQRCEGCQLYTATGGGKGKCVLFQQGLVAAGGHCTSWVKKPA